jgi:hypothetical protein
VRRGREGGTYQHVLRQLSVEYLVHGVGILGPLLAFLEEGLEVVELAEEDGDAYPSGSMTVLLRTDYFTRLK